MPRVFFSSNAAHHFEQFLFVLSFKKYVFKNFFSMICIMLNCPQSVVVLKLLMEVSTL